MLGFAVAVPTDTFATKVDVGTRTFPYVAVPTDTFANKLDVGTCTFPYVVVPTDPFATKPDVGTRPKNAPGFAGIPYYSLEFPRIR